MGQTAYVVLHTKSCRRKHRAPSHELLHIVDSKLQCAGNRFVARIKWDFFYSVVTSL